jgi:Histidine phosphatase superfamily (branch 1)
VHGDADGKPWHQIKTAFRGGPHAHPDRPWASGSDTWNGYLTRTGGVIAGLIDDHQGGRVLFASHGETVLAAHTLLLDLRAGLAAGFTLEHGSLTHWQLHRNRFDEQRWMLQRHNDTARPPKGPGHLMNTIAHDPVAVARRELGPLTLLRGVGVPPHLRLLLADGQRYVLKCHTDPHRFTPKPTPTPHGCRTWANMRPA